MVDNGRGRAPNFSQNEGLNQRLSQKRRDSSGSPDMSFGTSSSPDRYSKRHNEESIRALAEGEDEAEAGLKAIPYKVVMLGDVSVGKTCIV